MEHNDKFKRAIIKESVHLEPFSLNYKVRTPGDEYIEDFLSFLEAETGDGFYKEYSNEHHVDPNETSYLIKNESGDRFNPVLFSFGIRPKENPPFYDGTIEIDIMKMSGDMKLLERYHKELESL